MSNTALSAKKVTRFHPRVGNDTLRATLTILRPPGAALGVRRRCLRRSAGVRS